MPLTGNESNLNGKYRIIKLIGEGGMARVWLAEEVQFGNRQVAIKEPAPDLLPGSEEELTKRFRREVIVCAALEQAHVPNIVRALTAEPFENDLLLVLEYMPGGDLTHLIKAQPRGISLQQSLEITHALLAALAGVHAHALDIVHRDVKPSNILFDARGVAHLGDFGLAQMAQQSERSTLQGGTHPGTAAYMAPEQASNVAYLTGAADLYALGCVLFEMLTGKRYKRCRAGTLASSLNAAVPGWLDEVLAKALAEDPFDRYQDAEEMAQALKAGEAAPAQERQEADARAAREAEQARLENERIEAEVKRRLAQQAAADERVQRQSPPAAQPAVLRPAAPVVVQQELVLTLAPGVIMPLVRVPAGEFTMGSNDYDDEKPPHRVKLDEYLIGKYAVTVAQFKAFVQASGYKASSDALRTGKDDHPVNNVSWDDAVAFCRWASQVTGKAVRLPTEAEWEKAARGTDGRVYPWGNQPPDNNLCNFNSSIGDTTPVGQYSPAGDSPYGCADMAGNVCDWVNDWYAADYYGKSPGSNPTGPSGGQYRVLRGGGWYNYAVNLRSAYRNYNDPVDRNDDVGFRCAVSPGT